MQRSIPEVNIGFGATLGDKVIWDFYTYKDRPAARAFKTSTAAFKALQHKPLEPNQHRLAAVTMSEPSWKSDLGFADRLAVVDKMCDTPVGFSPCSDRSLLGGRGMLT